MFYGPHVCGEAVDMCGNEILTGSWRPEDQLEIWDFSTAKKITGIISFFFFTIYSSHIFVFCIDDFLWSLSIDSTHLSVHAGLCVRVVGIEWNTAKFSGAGQQACMLYAAQFSKEGGGKYIVAGGSGSNEAKIIDHHSNNTVIGK